MWGTTVCPYIIHGFVSLTKVVVYKTSSLHVCVSAIVSWGVWTFYYYFVITWTVCVWHCVNNVFVCCHRMGYVCMTYEQCIRTLSLHGVFVYDIWTLYSYLVIAWANVCMTLCNESSLLSSAVMVMVMVMVNIQIPASFLEVFLFR